MPRPDTVQWNCKQFLGDNKVLGMDWDALGMHAWLLNLAPQEKPPGSIPNDMAVIRRWLRSPSDDVWRRVQPQIFAAWYLEDNRWFNKGMVETFERKAKYAVRPQNQISTTPVPQAIHKREIDIETKESIDLGSKEKPSLNESENFDGAEWFRRIIREHPRAERGHEAQVAVMEAVLWVVGEGIRKDRISAAEYVLKRTKLYKESTRTWPDKRMITGAAKWYRGQMFEQDEAVWRGDGADNKTVSKNRTEEALRIGLGLRNGAAAGKP